MASSMTMSEQPCVNLSNNVAQLVNRAAVAMAQEADSMALVDPTVPVDSVGQVQAEDADQEVADKVGLHPIKTS